MSEHEENTEEGFEPDGDAVPLDDYEVGYGCPPMKTRYKPGQSGNPAGRPKKEKQLCEYFDEKLNEKIQITKNGKTIKVTKGYLLWESIVNDAISGDKQARKIVIDMKEKQILKLDRENDPVAKMLDDSLFGLL